MDFTTRLALSKPDPDPTTGDFVDVSVLNQNADTIDNAISFTVCTSSSRPAVPFQGQAILETDTGATQVWGGSAWLPLLVGGGIFTGRIGLGTTPSASSARLVTTLAAGGGATSQFLIRTSSAATGHRAIALMGGPDTTNRWWIDYDGSMQWAGEGLGGDTNLYRGGANVLQCDDEFRSARSAATSLSFGAFVTGDAQLRYAVQADGSIEWGDGAGARDVTLYRPSANRLETDATLNLKPAVGSGSVAIEFNEGYSLYVDNTGAGADGSRVWLDGPDGGEMVIGPRSGAANFDRIRLRTDQTTGNAANTYLDGSNYIMKSTSSRRYKVNIRPEMFDRERLMLLVPVRFNDKREFAEKGEGAKEHIGLIAEEVHELGLTEFVNYDEQGRPDGVQYERLALGLLDIVKDLAKRVSALEQSIA